MDTNIRAIDGSTVTISLDADPNDLHPWTTRSWKHSPGPFHNRTAESFTDELRRWFVQYEEDEPTPPEWIVKRFQRLYGIEVNPASVYDAMRVPLRVELGPRLLEQLPQ